MGLEGDLDPPGMAATVQAEADVVINEAHVVLNCVENRLNLQLHSWSAARWRACFSSLAAYRNPGRSAIALRPPGSSPSQALLHQQFLSGASWRRAGRSRWGPRYGGSKSFGFPGLRGRKAETFGYRYGGDLDGPARSHTLAAPELLEVLLPAARPLDSARSAPRDGPRPPKSPRSTFQNWTGVQLFHPQIPRKTRKSKPWKKTS